MKYKVEFETVIEVDADDAIDAYDKACDIVKKQSVEEFNIWVDGNLYN